MRGGTVEEKKAERDGGRKMTKKEMCVRACMYAINELTRKEGRRKNEHKTSIFGETWICSASSRVAYMAEALLRLSGLRRNNRLD